MFDIMPKTLDELEQTLQSHKLEIGEYALKKCSGGYIVILNNGEEVSEETLENALLWLVLLVGEYTLREKPEKEKGQDEE